MDEQILREIRNMAGEAYRIISDTETEMTLTKEGIEFLQNYLCDIRFKAGLLIIKD